MSGKKAFFCTHFTQRSTCACIEHRRGAFLCSRLLKCSPLTKEQAVRRKALIATIFKLIRCIIRDLAILLLREVGQSQSLITFVSSSTLPTTGRSSYFSPLSYSACKMISSASNNWASIRGGGKKTGILQSGCSQSHPPSPFLFFKKNHPNLTSNLT